MKAKKYNEKTLKHRRLTKYNVPVIGHFANHSVRYNSILEAEELTGINYHLIFENCIGLITSAQHTHWEYENGKHWIKYHAKRVRGKKLLRPVGFNG